MKKKTTRSSLLFIGLGIIFLSAAVYNGLNTFNINIEDALTWVEERVLATVTPDPSLQSRPIRVNMQPAGTNLPEFEPTQVPTAAVSPIADEDSGFVPIQLEQHQEQTVDMVEEKGEVPLLIPQRLLIPSIDLDAPIISAEQEVVRSDGVDYTQWVAPNIFAAGWHSDSAGLGQVGNMVLNGHHNVSGEVFKNLEDLKEGDRISIYGEDDQRYGYLVTNVMILPERDVSLQERLENARWILPSSDERLTMVTCWPYYSNTHRLVIVAKPLETDSFQAYQPDGGG